MADTLGAILSGARNRLGWSLRDAERAAGIPNAHISQIETGKIEHPGITVLVKLSKVYGVPMRQLAEAAGYGSDWSLTAERDRLGYVVAVINQASGIAETVESEELYPTRDEADRVADAWRSHAVCMHRRDRYRVCEVVPVEESDEGGTRHW